MSLVVHGVVASSPHGTPPPLPRGDDVPQQLRLVPHRSLAAVVSPTDQTMLLPARQDLLQHTRVLEELATVTTVLPMRFGVVVEDDDALVRTLLDPDHDTLVRRLEHLRGHVEWRVRGTYDEDRVLRGLVDSDPHLRRLAERGDLASRLTVGERVMEGIALRRRADEARVADTVRRHATSVTVAAVTGPLDAFSMSALVHEDRREEFDAAIEQLARQDSSPFASIELVGPLPPFSFIEEEVE